MMHKTYLFKREFKREEKKRREILLNNKLIQKKKLYTSLLIHLMGTFRLDQSRVRTSLAELGRIKKKQIYCLESYFTRVDLKTFQTKISNSASTKLIARYPQSEIGVTYYIRSKIVVIRPKKRSCPCSNMITIYSRHVATINFKQKSENGTKMKRCLVSSREGKRMHDSKENLLNDYYPSHPRLSPLFPRVYYDDDEDYSLFVST